MSPCARTLIAGLLTGLSSLVDFVRVQPHVSLFYINGFDRPTPDVREFFIILAIAARVPNSVLALLLEDGRVMRRVDLIKAKLAEELLNVV